MNEEKIILSDGSGHDYLVPLAMREEFYTWVEYMEDWEEYEGTDFDQFRLNIPISSIIIRDYEIEEN